MRKRILIIISLSCFLQSCRVNKDDVCGIYSIRYQPCGEIFKINEDGTFHYLSGGGHRSGEAFGTYHLSKNGRNIIFDSDLDGIDNIPIVVTESKCNNNTLVIFNKPMESIKESHPNHTGYLEDAHGNRYPSGEYDSLYYNIVINDTINYSIYSDSIFIPSQIQVRSFYFTMKGYFEELFNQPFQDTAATEKYYIKDTSNNVFNVSFNFTKMKFDELFYRIPMNDTLRVRRNCIIFDVETAMKGSKKTNRATYKLKKIDISSPSRKL